MVFIQISQFGSKLLLQIPLSGIAFLVQSSLELKKNGMEKVSFFGGGLLVAVEGFENAEELLEEWEVFLLWVVFETSSLFCLKIPIL